jgi:hypothetical protein
MAPTAVAILGDRLHVVTVDTARGSAVHFPVSRQGRPGRITALPLEQAHGITAAGDGLVVTGAADGRPVALHLDADGRVGWRLDVQPDGPLAFWPRPVTQPNGAVRLVWGVDADGGRSRLAVAELAAARSLAVHTIDRDDASTLLEPAGGRRGTLIARVHGAPSHVEVLTVEDGGRLGPTRDFPEATYPVTLSWAVGRENTLLWASSRDRNLNVAGFDDQLNPTRQVMRPVTARPPARIRLASLAQRADGCLALRWQTAEADELLPLDDDAGPPSHRQSLALADFIAPFDAAAQRLGAILSVPDPGVWSTLAAWLGDELLVLHGSSVPAISVYQGAG